MTPARQGLEPRHRPRVQVDDGLEEGLDLAPHEGVAQVRFQRQARQAVGLQRPTIGRRPAPPRQLGLFDRQLDAAQQFGGVGRVGPALGRHRPDRQGGIDVEAGQAQGLFQRLAQAFAAPGPAASAPDQDGELVLADAGRDAVLGKGGREARSQGRQHQVGALMAQGLVEPPQTVQVGHDHFIVPDRSQRLGHAHQEGAAVQQARQRVPVGAGELGFQGDDARRAQPVLQPDAAPQAGLAAAHPQAHGDLGPLSLGLEQAVGQGAVLGHGQGGEGRARTLGRQRPQAQRAGGAGEADLVLGGRPYP
ncbi:hypothetical protein D3C73_638890 [compost metagenome]